MIGKSLIEFAYKHKLRMSSTGAWLEINGYFINIESELLGYFSFSILVQNTSGIKALEINKVLRKKNAKFRGIKEKSVVYAYRWLEEQEDELWKTLRDIINYLETKKCTPHKISISKFEVIDKTHLLQSKRTDRIGLIRFLLVVFQFWMLYLIENSEKNLMSSHGFELVNEDFYYIGTILIFCGLAWCYYYFLKTKKNYIWMLLFLNEPFYGKSKGVPYGFLILNICVFSELIFFCAKYYYFFLK